MLKAGHAVSILREGFWEDLDSELAVELRVRCSPDLSR
jgi:hypothetical protein